MVSYQQLYTNIDNIYCPPKIRVESLHQIVNKSEVSHDVVIWRDAQHEEKRSVLTEYNPDFFRTVHHQEVGALKSGVKISGAQQ